MEQSKITSDSLIDTQYSDIIKFCDNSFSKLDSYLSERNLCARVDPVYPELAIIKQLSQADRSQNGLKGLIFRISDLLMVAPPVPVPIDVVLNEETSKYLEDNLTIRNIYDGVNMRVYNYNDMWLSSTPGMIYPSKSWRGSTTFIEMFQELTYDIDFDTVFNKELCYYMIMVHPEHHNIIKYTEPMLVMTQINRGETKFSQTEFKSELERINVSLGNLFVDPYEVLEPFNINIPVTFGGWVVSTTTGELVNIETDQYMRARELRGNEPDSRKRWASLNPTNRSHYVRFFPEDEGAFAEMDMKFNDLCDTFYREYTARFKLRTHVIHHSRHVKAMSQLHEIYLQRRREGQDNLIAKITKQDVYNFLVKKHPSELYYLINPNNVPSSSASEPSVVSNNGIIVLC